MVSYSPPVELPCSSPDGTLVKFVLTRYKILLALALTGLLTACSSGGGAILRTFQDGFGFGKSTALAPLNPALRYLRLTVDGQVGLMVLGYVDPAPRTGQAPVEVWYSSSREVLRLSDGRVIGVAGLADEWRNVSIDRPPSWQALVQSNQGVTLTRKRDVMPGYRYGVEDKLEIRKIPPPSRSSLADLDPGALTWFEESVVTGKAALPPARYAVDAGNGQPQVVYAEQCLTEKLCFSWQKWPALARGGQ